MLRTRVGYAGGTTEAPTYRDLGDHTEALQIEFDTRVISYDDLLEVFWAAHDPFARPWSRQYRAVVWTHDEAQARAVRATIVDLEGDGERRVATAVEPATRFWIAEAYHQKYALQSRRGLRAALFGEDADDVVFRESTLAARVNGWIAGHGSASEIAAQLDALGVPEPLRKALASYLGDRAPLSCR